MRKKKSTGLADVGGDGGSEVKNAAKGGAAGEGVGADVTWSTTPSHGCVLAWERISTASSAA